MKKTTFTLVAFTALFFAGVNAQNLSLVKDINPTGDSDIMQNILFNGDGYFNANDGTHGIEIGRAHV